MPPSRRRWPWMPRRHVSAHFVISEPPFEVFPFMERDRVERAYRWLIVEQRLENAVAPREGQADSRGDRLAVLAEILERVEKDELMAWLVLTWLCSQLAEHIGVPAGEKWWTLRRRCYPPAEEMVQFAARMGRWADSTVRKICDHAGQRQPDLFQDVTVVAGQMRQVADEVLNDVCRGRRPSRVRDIGDDPVQWAVRGLAGVLIQLRQGVAVGSQVLCVPQRPMPSLYGPEHD